MKFTRLAVVASICLGLSHNVIAQHSDASDGRISHNVQQLIQGASAETVGARSKSDVMGGNTLYQLMLKLEADANLAAIRSSIQQLDGELELSLRDYAVIQAWVPHHQMMALAEIEGVRHIGLPDYAVSRRGTATTQGDEILQARDLRTALGVADTEVAKGIKVGVIAQGAENYAAAQGTNDLSGAVSFSKNTADENRIGSGDEGTAMMEIIYDIAPAVELKFCGAQTSVDMIACIQDLAKDSDIIVDDLGFYREPYFEDGMVAKAAANTLNGEGIIFVSAAGNDAMSHYQADFKVFKDTQLHAFGEQDYMPIIINRGGGKVVLQWAERFGSSNQRYRLRAHRVRESVEGELIIAEATRRGKFVAAGDPINELRLKCQLESGCNYRLSIERLGEPQHELELFVVNGIISNNDFTETEGRSDKPLAVPADSIFGHPAVDGVLAVGAINASNNGQDDIRRFSSRGPSSIFFNRNGAAEFRAKPDITGIDGVTVSGAGGFDMEFSGTSAAAPHIAGIAAVLLGASAGVSGNQVIAALRSTAVELGEPGHDPQFGAGRAHALNAYQMPNAVIDRPRADKQIAVGESINFKGSCTALNGDEPDTSVYGWSFDNASGSGITDLDMQKDAGLQTFANQGVYTVTFNCGTAVHGRDSTPATRRIAVGLPLPADDVPTQGGVNSDEGDVGTNNIGGGSGSFGLLGWLLLVLGSGLTQRISRRIPRTGCAAS